MQTKKILITRRIPDAGLALLKRHKGFRVVVNPKDAPMSHAALLKEAKGCSAILSLLNDKIDNAVLNAAGPGLKIVANYAVGYDNIDVAACEARGVKVANTPGVLTDAVAEHALALMMAAARRIAESDRFTRAGKYTAWAPELLLGAQMKGKTLGVLGLGRIGSEVAERAAKGLGMRVVYYDIARDKGFEKRVGATFATVDSLLKRSDVVSVHVPLLPSTRHIINATRLKKMKKTAYLVNTSRGPVIDEKALVVALKKGTIAGAALDVFENEPALSPGLGKLENVTLTPHTASATIEARSAMAELAARAIIDVLRGKTPKNLVRLKKR